MPTLFQSRSTRDVIMMIRGAEVCAELSVPLDAKGVVILAYPTGNSRKHPKQQHVVDLLNNAGLATLFCDLLTIEEELLSEITGEFRHDVTLLSSRLIAVTDWCHANLMLRGLPIGYLGTGAGAAAAFNAAAKRPELVKAIVTRGGRLDLAWTSLAKVKAPVLLIAGENDAERRKSYEVALPHIGSARKAIAIISRAGALFSEPSMLDEYAEQAARWFNQYLGVDTDVAVSWSWEI
jgi:putative phosphoribosyl transferase